MPAENKMEENKNEFHNNELQNNKSESTSFDRKIFRRSISKTDLIEIGKLLITWLFLNVLFNILGLWLAKLISPKEFFYLQNIGSEFLRPVVIQIVFFSIVFFIGYSFLVKKKLAPYLFVILQFVIFNIIFLLNLKFQNGISFHSTFNNPGIIYLSTFGQYLVDVFYLFFPIKGNFDESMFNPVNVGVFYLGWIALPAAYYYLLTLISINAKNFIFDKK